MDGGVCVSYFHRNIFSSVWHNRQASGYVQTTKHIHSGYIIVSGAEQLLGQKLPASGLLKISIKFSGKREASPLSFIQPADSYSCCHLWSRKARTLQHEIYWLLLRKNEQKKYLQKATVGAELWILEEMALPRCSGPCGKVRKGWHFISKSETYSLFLLQQHNPTETLQNLVQL